MTELNFEKFFVRKFIIYYDEAVETEKGKSDTFDPVTIQSLNFKNWRAVLDLKTCFECRSRHGQIYQIDEAVDPSPPLHINCRCVIIPMESIVAGNATKDGNDGADFWIKYFDELPEYYVSKAQAYLMGWKHGKSPVKFISGKMIGGDVYINSDGHLPDAPGRIWHEADINYYEGKRNKHRILWSNDGLIFVTYDHYETFYEIV